MYRTHFPFSFGELARQTIDPLQTEGGHSGSARRSVVVVCACVCVRATLRFRIYLSTLRLFRPCFFRLPRTSLPPSGGRSIRGFSSKKTVQMLDNAKPISLLDCTCLYSQVWQKKKKRLALFKFAIYFLHFVCSRPLFRYLSALTGTIAAGNKLMLIYAVSVHTAQHTGSFTQHSQGQDLEL